MSRPLRIQYEDAWYHVMNRGAARKNIFHNNSNRELFLKLLQDINQKYKIEIHAYCLMSNHYYLLVRTPFYNLR
jgi:putative transposase